MKILRGFYNTLFLCAFSYPALAASANPSLTDVNKFYTETMGVSFALENKELDIFVDQKKNMEYMVPRIQAMGIWPGINPESLRVAPTISVGLISIYINVMILKYVYNEKNTDDINIHTYLTLLDDKSRHLLFSYKINRSIYNNMDLDKTDALLFSSLVKDFEYSNWYNERSSKETKSIYHSSK